MQYKDVKQSPLMRFKPCRKRLGLGHYVDTYGYQVRGGDCGFPVGHDGPCADVEYEKITYPDATV